MAAVRSYHKHDGLNRMRVFPYGSGEQMSSQFPWVKVKVLAEWCPSGGSGDTFWLLQAAYVLWLVTPDSHFPLTPPPFYVGHWHPFRAL